MKVLCFGDSNTYGFDPRSFLGSRYSRKDRWVDILADKTGWVITNDGMNGREVPAVARTFTTEYDLYLVMLGTNDLLQGGNACEISDRMESFLSAIPSKRVILISPPNLKPGEWVSDTSLIVESQKLADLYRSLADKNEYMFANSEEWGIDILFDGVHFSEKGHHSFAKRLYGFLKEKGYVHGREKGRDD